LQCGNSASVPFLAVLVRKWVRDPEWSVGTEFEYVTPGLELVRLTANSTAAVAPNICSTHGLQAARVPYTADHNLTRLYQLSVNYKHTEHRRITAAVVTLLRARDNADSKNTSKSCKVNFPGEAFKTALFTRTTITKKIFPRTTRQLFHVYVEGDPGTV
jgi:hypothetical protein